MKALLLAALLALSHPPTEADARVFVDAAAPVALDRPLWPVPHDEAADSAEVAATGLLLGAVAFHESRMAQDVATCRTRGPGGSVTAYQLLGPVALSGWSVAEVCASPEIASRAALGVLELHARRRLLVPAQVVAGYASGDAARGSRAAREIVGIWVTLCRSARVECSPYSFARPRWIR